VEMKNNRLIVYINQNICVDIDLFFLKKFFLKHFMLKSKLKHI